MQTKPITPKAFELFFENRHSYVYAYVHSNSDQPVLAREYLKDIAQKCTEMQCSRLVIDNGLPQSFLVWDMFPLVTFFPKIGIECTKVAIIDKFAPIVQKEFSVVVGRDCGLEVHVFTELHAAESWLLDS